ncbi:MAG: capsule assembly Wzi family protein [Dysgonamonadaceae bacterium]|jgi:hypothetical protein|nr:capsule assembly Wzi family protein [Dysgonamonadaceae bacterium]
MTRGGRISIITSISLWTVCFLGIPAFTFSQDSLKLRMETALSVSNQERAPFWLVSNSFGKIPLQSGNAYLESACTWGHRMNHNLHLTIAGDVLASTQAASRFFIQQLYGEIAYRSIYLTVGAKERYHSMLDQQLSSGDFIYSSNARPIPEINIHIPAYTAIPFTQGKMKFRGDFAVGKSFDNHYILETKAAGQFYATDILWHHKSAFFLVEDPTKRFPFFVTVGFEHGAQWGGWSSFNNMGTMPHTVGDFVKVALGKGGGTNAPEGEQINTLGNHVGTYNLKLAYQTHRLEIAVYKQHYFDDNSGMEYANWRDGIWGIECTFPRWDGIKKIVCEYIHTTDQSGPLHFLDYYPLDARGGGNDDYYNHFVYHNGWSYWGRGLGNPLLTSPEYNANGVMEFMNNRIKAFHLGVDGQLLPHLSYRLLATKTEALGRMYFPFLDKKSCWSALAECSYTGWEGWECSLQLAFDRGSLYGDNLGAVVRLSKSGVLALSRR